MKRILALSGGGVRGIVEVAFLEAVENVYKRRHGPDLRLCDIFHLVGGTSTGALIAAAVALGHPLDQIRDFYITRAERFFSRRRWWAFGQTAAFDGDALELELRRDVGDLTLGSSELQTYLAVVLKRMDTGQPWIVNNIPTAPYFETQKDGRLLGHRHYELARVLRATTAAPTLFEQHSLDITHCGEEGVFVDGGMSPYNDPSLALLQLARLRAFGLEWPVGTNNMFVLSIGAGRYRQYVPSEVAERMSPIRVAYLSMRGMLMDAEQHSLTMMEWLGQSRAPSYINSEVGHLDRDSLTGSPAFSFLRLDLPLEVTPLSEASITVTERELRGLRRIDNPDAIAPLYEMTKAYIAATLDLEALLV
ncbi:MAG: patatin-like phospholipase family protein [Hyphomicrobiales bacterium]